MHEAFFSMLTGNAESYQAYNTWRQTVKMTLECAGRIARDISAGRSVMLVHSTTFVLKKKTKKPGKKKMKRKKNENKNQKKKKTETAKKKKKNEQKRREKTKK